MKKIIFTLLLLSTTVFAVEEVRSYENVRPDNVSFEMTLDMYKRDIDNYAFFKKDSNVRENPSTNSEVITVVPMYTKLPLLSLVKNDDGSKWYKVKLDDDKEGYVYSKLIIHRKYDYKKAITEIEKINRFINKYKRRDIKVISVYSPLNVSKDLPADKLGNSANQALQVYTNEDMTDFYNIPDRSLVVVLGKTEDELFYKIVSPYYKDVLYLKVEDYNRLYNSLIFKPVNKFIYISKRNQNEIAIEKTSDGYRIVTESDVTTGRDSKFGFATPYGDFMVAITKPIMPYVDDTDPNTIVGDAKYAIRFTGGAYIHGIPSLLKPEDTREERKALVQKMLGTYAISHKCVRNPDEVVKTLYDWIGYKHIWDNGQRIPKEPVIVIVR